MKNILILTTGGTIEKSYSEKMGSLENRESLLQEKFLKKLRLPNLSIKLKEIMAKDSLVMNSNDRESICMAIKDGLTENFGILVLHGTDSLEVTLKHCREDFPTPNKPIIFTGAMKPAGFDDSDALQNFTEALFAVQLVQPGYYLSFHGQLFSGVDVKKNHELGTFEMA